MTLVLGLGNPILRDDGVGIKVAREIGRRLISSSIDVREASVAGLGLLELIQGYTKVVLIDSIQIKGGVPGEIFLLDLNDLKHTIRLSSPHDVNFATAMELGKRLGLNLPQDIRIYAVQVEDISTFGENCSPSVERAISGIAEKIIRGENLAPSVPVD
jgi:hydrogenase maturation protease